MSSTDWEDLRERLRAAEITTTSQVFTTETDNDLYIARLLGRVDGLREALHYMDVADEVNARSVTT